MIALIDYRAGNLTSVRKALAALKAEVWSPSDAVELRDASGIIVPGVGHFGATAALTAPWRSAILTHVSAQRPLLGICLGLQWLFEGSAEAPDVPGLGLLPGRCTLIDAPGLKVPHVGWNTLRLRGAAPIVEGVRNDAHVYFTHSYAAPVTPETVATTMYGAEFASVVAGGQVFGVQFHPEKSSDMGLRILRNFIQLCSASASSPASTSATARS